MAAYKPTELEIGVIELIADGLTYATITRRLTITENALKKLLIKLYSRTGVNSQAGLIDWAWWNGYLGDRATLLEANADLRKQVEALDPAGDHDELRAEIESLRNQVENLRDMYRTAVNFRDWKP